MKKNIATLTLSLMLFPVSLIAHAVPLTVNGGWVMFFFPGLENGSSPYNWYLDAEFTQVAHFEFDLTQNAMLTVQDIGDTTDQFEVYDNNAYLFVTSAPFGGGYTSFIKNTLDPDETALHPEFSQGSTLIGSGHHDITGKNIRFTSTDYGGAAYIRIDTVPEPATLLLIILGASLMVYRQNRRNSIS